MKDYELVRENGEGDGEINVARVAQLVLIFPPRYAW